MGWLPLALVLAFAPATASAADFTPSPSATDGAANSLRDALSQANANGEADTITLAAGTYSLTLSGDDDANASGDLDVTEAGTLVIVGAGPNQTIIRQEAADRVFQVFAGATVIFRNLTITGGDTPMSGGGIYSSGDVTLDNATVRENTARGAMATQGGGGVYNDGGTLMLVNRAGVRNNRASGASGSGGGIFNANGGTVSASRARIAGNRANRAGGGIEDASVTGMSKGGTEFAVVLTQTDLNNNIAGPTGTAAPGNGGGLHVTGNAGVQIVGGTVRNNFAAREGGGLWNGAGRMDLQDVTIETNAAAGAAADDGGGGVFNNGGQLEISGGVISANQATGASGSGGGVFHLGGTTAITGTMISGNSASRAGGGLETAVGGMITLTDVDFDGNSTGPAPGNGGAVHVTAGDLTAMGGTVTGNSAAREGGGFWNNAGWTMTVDGTSFSGNDAQGPAADDGGGALFNNGGVLIVRNASVMDNMASGTAGSGGGLFNLGGRMVVTDTEVSGNTANRAGGGIEDANSLPMSTASGMEPTGTYLTNVTLTGNDAGASPGNGGGVHSGAGFVEFSSGTVSGNTAVEGGGLWTSGTMRVGDGGAIGARADLQGGYLVTVSGNTATGNDADQGGGGLYNQAGDLFVVGASIAGNQATGTSGSGGGILNNNGTLTVNLSDLTDNTANRAGGGIEDVTTAMRGTGGPSTTLTDLYVAGNNAGAAPGNGGGLHIGGPGSVSVESSWFENNDAVEGGGIWNSGAGSVSIAMTTVRDNAAVRGGGLYQSGSGGTMLVRQSLVAFNTADSGAGAFSEGGDVTVINSTISSNMAERAGGGVLQADGSVSLVSTTVAANMATVRGGGLRVTGGAMSLQNAIVAENMAPNGRSCSGAVVSNGYSLIEDRAGCALSGDAATSLSNVAARLADLADNGGPTMTHALEAGSPAIDAGQTTEPTDQRGFLRDDAQNDMGAFELGASEPEGEDLVTRADTAPAEATLSAETAETASLQLMDEPVRLGAIAPNPLRAGTTGAVTFAVREAQTVELALYDATGRRVATLFSGTADGSQAQEATLDTRALASGTYIVRLTGETVNATQVVTLVR